MKSTRRIFIMTGLALVPLATSVALADIPKCHVCKMKIDHEHRYHFRYKVDGAAVEICSLTCAHQHWAKNKNRKMKFLAMDFVTGEFSEASRGHFLVNSTLKVGNGMDKSSAVYFVDKTQAEQARRANGGQLVKLEAAVKACAR